MRKRITFTFSIIIVLITLFSGICSYLIFRNAYFETTETNLNNSLNYITEDLMPRYLATGNTDELENYAVHTQQRINIIDVNGNVIFESTDSVEAMENHFSRPEVQGALSGEITVSTRYSDTLHEKMFYMAAPFEQDGVVTYVTRIGLPINILNDISSEIINNLLLIACLSVLVSIVIFTLLISNETKPLYEASEFARRIARGDYKSHMSMISDRERVGDLVDSLNQMADQLDASFTRLNRRNTELASVLSSMEQGIIALDTKNKIILINDAARQIFKIPMNKSVKGRGILEVYRGPFIFELQDKLKEAEDKRLDYETQIDDEIYKVTSAQIVDVSNNSIRGTMVILSDVTVIKNLENIRRDFVANVSHELKTPITTIKGFIETIQENDITDKKTLNHFYNIISDESERLTRLVGDILTLSHLENNQNKNDSSQEELSIEGEVQKIFDMLKMQAESKQIELIYQSERDETIYFNPDNFRQMMLNLIDNAVKYSDGGRIMVSTKRVKQKLCIQVSDTGCGIPERDIPRIFERFYRVDKSRSKANGGTGLGLAIVKHIVQNSGGSIEVESVPNEGTTFTIYFDVSDVSN